MQSGNRRALQTYILINEAEGGLVGLGPRRCGLPPIWLIASVADIRHCVPQQTYYPRRNTMRYERLMSTGEIAVYMGHRKRWQ